ncbi:alpha/beta hydrolase [Limnohabitans sp.]|uniref:alpha/beta fold hydrolase n=1 Tax=Limnohabitans sp. TaxID=1907725 RepID=UPI00286F1FC6|nr:alpha/beta hydrolase [Limnohabitans sp.]
MNLMQLKDSRLEVVRIPAPPEAKTRPDRAPLVFLHEGLGSVAMWHTRDGFWPEQVCQATGRAGVVFSRRGYGQSEDMADVRGANALTPDYMHHEAWHVLPELLAALHIQAPVLLGHSDGGTIALLHAARHALSACIVMAPHVKVEAVSITAIEAARDAYVNGNLRERLAKFHKHVETAFWQWNDVWLSPAFQSFDIRAECQGIRCPVLALQGVDDAYGTLAQIEDIAPQFASVSRHALPACGHSPHRDQPAQTLALITDFLRDLA